MMKSSHTQKVPKIRFSAYEKDWETEKLGKITKIYDGTHQTPKYVTSGVPFYSVEQVTSNNFSDTKYISEDVYKKESERVKIEKGDVLMTRIGDVGTARMIDWDVKASFYVSLALIKQAEAINSSYLAQYLNSSFFQHEVWKKTLHVAFPKKINLGDIGKCSVKFPNLEEQQKIADFLVVVDNWIQNLKSQKEELEKYKKGIMQKIFSQEVRFKDDTDNDFPDWKTKKINELVTILMGQSPDSKNYNTNKSGLPLVQGNADISNRFTRPRNWTTQTTKECNVGDLILTVRAPVGYVAKSKHNACIGRGVCALRPKYGSDIEFIYQYLLYYEKRWAKYEQGSTFTAVNSKDIANLKLQTPSLKEQIKIAGFLKDLDFLIHSKENQMKFAEQWKKSLMQEMFI